MTQAALYQVLLQADSPKTGDDISLRHDDMFKAIVSSHRGASRPAYAVAGTIWADSDTEELFYYDGTSDIKITKFVSVPANATSSGNPGDISADASFAYYCIATNTWVRVAVATW